MPTVSSTLKMFDATTGPLKSIFTSMNLVIRSFEQMQDVTERNSDVSRTLTLAKKQIASAEAEIRRQIEQADKAQKRFNQSMMQGNTNARGLLNSIKGIAATYLSIQGLRTVANISDDYANSLARLELINDGLQTTSDLQEKVFAAADRTRGSYTDMAAVIGRMGILASDAFSSNDELIAFTELMQKSFRIGGASTMEQQAGMYQLSQAMAAGRLQGDEFRSIMENAPMLADAIAKFTGKTKGELKEMSAEGTITADIIKGAMFAAADEINAKFETMPITFGGVMNLIKNTALQTFGPAIQHISQLLNDPKMITGIEGTGKALAAASVAAIWLLSVVGMVSNFVSTNWPTIGPIVWGIATVMGVWAIRTLAVRTAQGLLNLALGKGTIAIFAQTVATKGLTAAWHALNAAQKANVFIFLISLIVGLFVWLVKLWQTNDQFAAGLKRAWNSILNFFDKIPIFFAKIGMAVVNKFMDMRVGALEIMQNFINGVIDGINWLIDKLNKIPGVEIEAIGNVEFAASEKIKAEAIRQAGEEAIRSMEENAARKAAEREQKVQDFLDSRAAKRAAKEAEMKAKETSAFDWSKWQSGMPNINKVNEVGKIRDTVDISSEDLKTMRELAEMKSIQNFVTLTPTVSVQTGPIQNGYDVDTIVARIETVLTEQIASSAKGYYGV